MTFLMAIILFGILIFIHELGHFLFAKLYGVKVLKFSLGFGPKIIGRQFGETEYRISAFPLGGYVKMIGEEPEEELSEEDKKRSLQNTPLLKRSMIVFAGPLFNILLTFVIFTFVLSIGLSVPVPNLANLMPVVDELEPGQPAQLAGIKPGDKVTAINNKEIATWIEIVNVVADNPGNELEFTLLRDGQKINTVITPSVREIKDPEGNTLKIGRIGIKKTNSSMFSQIKSASILNAPIQGAIATWKMGFFIFDSIGMMISGEISAKNISGPVTIISESSKAAAAGILPYLMFMALLSVNLGILNLLPIPVLDGGHLLFYAIEGVIGKPVSEKAMSAAQKVGLALLLGLMVFALYNDVFRLLGSAASK
ncbi:MAG: RIP metalloprotease RseP [Dissulfurispiraceae bacterium]|jgi:regulator of sigma E protease|nr:RIP metalloprotease RseP [Dissulfurispiraceae bacterium]